MHPYAKFEMIKRINFNNKTLISFLKTLCEQNLSNKFLQLEHTCIIFSILSIKKKKRRQKINIYVRELFMSIEKIGLEIIIIIIKSGMKIRKMEY